ncbi:MAG: hypothetical protein ACTHM6_07625 [Tepidisphaeraceae bacterium]
MPSAIRKLGTFLFCVGCLAVVAGLVPVATIQVDGKRQQFWLAAAVVGGLLMVSGLVMDWLGSQAIRDQAPVQVTDVRPPAMRLSSRPAGGKGYREDLMA